MSKPSLLLTIPALGALAAACGPDGSADEDCDLLAGDLVITEVFADSDAPAGGSGADEGKEWFEVHNPTGAAIDLAGVRVLHSRPDGASEKEHILDALTIPAGGYLVLGNVLPELVAGHLDYGYGDELGDLYNSDGGKLALQCGTRLIDAALYDDVTPGKARGLDGGTPPDSIVNDDTTQWCEPPEDPLYEFTPANFGTPGEPNFDCAGGGQMGMCDDGGTTRPVDPPVLGDLVITELHPNPSAPSDTREWFEVFAVNGFDLNGVQLDRAGDSSDPDLLLGSACLAVAPGTYLVFARSADMAANGALPRVDGTFDFSMTADGDVRVLDPAGGVLDAFDYTDTSSTRSLQLDPDYIDATANDMERFWCDSTTPWAAGDLGSPGAANGQCTILPAPGTCTDPDTMTDRPIVSPTMGQVVFTEVMPNPSGTDSAQEWLEVRASVAVDLNGLVLRRTGGTVRTAALSKPECIEVAAGGHALLAHNADPVMNGGLPTVDALFGTGISLGDSCDLASNCGLQLETAAGQVIDAFTWTNAATSASRQLDPDVVDAAGNDVVTAWCDATTSYSATDKGTPRAANDVQCP
jgi:hypothetical protein